MHLSLRVSVILFTLYLYHFLHLQHFSFNMPSLRVGGGNEWIGQLPLCIFVAKRCIDKDDQFSYVYE